LQGEKKGRKKRCPDLLARHLGILPLGQHKRGEREKKGLFERKGAPSFSTRVGGKEKRNFRKKKKTWRGKSFPAKAEREERKLKKKEEERPAAYSVLPCASLKLSEKGKKRESKGGEEGKLPSKLPSLDSMFSTPQGGGREKKGEVVKRKKGREGKTGCFDSNPSSMRCRREERGKKDESMQGKRGKKQILDVENSGIFQSNLYLSLEAPRTRLSERRGGGGMKGRGVLPGKRKKRRGGEEALHLTKRLACAPLL